MKRSYKDLVSELRLKDYLFRICQDDDLSFIISQCLTYKDLKKVLKHEKIKKQLYQFAIEALYESSDYEDIEYHIMHMNALFDYSSYEGLKKRMFMKMSKREITINEYCVMRHLVNMINLESFLRQYVNNKEECAKICLLEDEYHLAYLFLKEQGYCDNEVVLDLLCAYSVKDYISLMIYYRKKRNEPIWERECIMY